MTAQTIAYPSTGWGQHVTLHNAKQDADLVLAWEVWFIALRAAAFGGWRPNGTRAGRDARPLGYLSPVGQCVTADDANAIGKSLDKALDRYAKMTPAERAGATFAVTPHPEQRDPWHWLAAPASERNERFGTHTPAFSELNKRIESRPGVRHEDEPVILALRALASWLRQGGDLTVDSTVPPGWYAPGIPTVTVRVLPTARPTQLGRLAVGPGDVVNVSIAEARSAVLLGIAERLDEAGAVVPLPAPTLDTRFAAVIAQRHDNSASTWS